MTTINFFLSFFLVPPLQQVANRVLCLLRLSIGLFAGKMSARQKKVQCIMWFAVPNTILIIIPKRRKEPNQIILYRVIIAVCFQICTKHINALCGQNVVLCGINWVVLIITIGLFGPVNRLHFFDHTNTFDAPFSELIYVTHYIPPFFFLALQPPLGVYFTAL